MGSLEYADLLQVDKKCKFRTKFPSLSVTYECFEDKIVNCNLFEGNWIYLIFPKNKRSDDVVKDSLIVRNNDNGKIFMESHFRGPGACQLLTTATRIAVPIIRKQLFVDGNFQLEMYFQVNQNRRQFYTPPMIRSNKYLSESLKTGDFSDVRFEVQGKVFKAHKVIVSGPSEVLRNCCMTITDHDDTIELEGITADIFECILRFIYGRGPPDEKTTMRSWKELISATNLLGLESLKMFVETTLVANRVINTFNATEYLFVAESNCCALLKEYAIHYIAACSKDIMDPKSFPGLDDAPALLREIVAVSAIFFSGKNVFPSMYESVDDLRRKVADKKVKEVYGSRESLQEFLKTVNTGNTRKRLLAGSN